MKQTTTLLEKMDKISAYVWIIGGIVMLINVNDKFSDFQLLRDIMLASLVILKGMEFLKNNKGKK